MFYAKFISNKYDTPTVGAYDGSPLNFTIYAFETKAERQAAIDAMWEAGGNGFKLTRKDVEGYYGREFYIDANGEVTGDPEDHLWTDAVYEEQRTGRNADELYREMVAERAPIWKRNKVAA